MKLLLITLHADPSIHPGAVEGGGTHLYINEIIDLLLLKEVETLIITRKASVGKDIITYGNVTIHRIALGPESQWDKNYLFDREKEINDLIRQALHTHAFTPHLIHSVYWYSGRAAMHLAKERGLPYIHTIISNGRRKELNGFVASKGQIETEQQIYSNADAIVAISDQEKEDITTLYQIDPDKIKVVGRGVDNLFLAQLFDKNGTLIPRKL